MMDLWNDESVTVGTTSAKEKSGIQDFFDGTSIFITGATGFLGRLILEKLLRSCRRIKRIYILVREKKGKSAQERYKELFDVPIYDELKRKNLKFPDKVVIMEGDCTLPNLGLSQRDQEIILNEVGCVFHCAATVRFDEKIRMTTYINVRATRDLLLLAKNMKHLKSFVYLSTAFSFCVHSEIKEEFYEPDVTGDKLINIVEALSDDVLERISPTLCGNWPNSYAFSKSVAEEVVRTYGKDLPIAIVRPSIVISTAKEPLAGWIDNVYGAVGIFAVVSLGLLHTLHCNKNFLAEMVPADFVINCSIAAAWYAGKERHSDVDRNNVQPIIYNYIVSNQSPITWGEVTDILKRKLMPIPPSAAVCYYFFRLNSYYWVHYLFLILFHKVPAYIVDFVLACVGKQPIAIKGYNKIKKFTEVLSYFSTRQWRFHNDNTQELWKRLNKEDQNLFDFNFDSFEWESFFYTWGRGYRVYLLKDPLETVPQAKIKYRKLKITYYTLVTILLLGLVKLLIILLNAIF